MKEHTAYVQMMIDAPVENIWDIMHDFNGLPAYHPAIQASHMESGDGKTVGSIRHLTLENGFVREKLLMFNDNNHAFDYSIIESSLPVEYYQASVRLQAYPGQNKTKCEWWADFDVISGANRDELINLIEEHVFKLGFQSVAKKLGVSLITEGVC